MGSPHCNLDKMLNEADNLMYAAKKAGGKQIHFSKTINTSTEATNLIENHEFNDVTLVKESNRSFDYLQNNS